MLKNSCKFLLGLRTESQVIKAANRVLQGLRSTQMGTFISLRHQPLPPGCPSCVLWPLSLVFTQLSSGLTAGMASQAASALATGHNLHIFDLFPCHPLAGMVTCWGQGWCPVMAGVQLSGTCRTNETHAKLTHTAPVPKEVLDSS
jgi:hypothetical protein